MKGKSYHCVHGYSAQDRIDTSLLSDKKPQFRRANPLVMLPSQSDISSVKDEMVIFVERLVDIFSFRITSYDLYFCSVLAQNFDQYKECEKNICMHIPSKYSIEMATKSKVV